MLKKTINTMKKIIEFLKGVAAQENGDNEFEALKPTLNPEEIELVETVFSLMADVAKWAAHQTVCACGILIESKDDKDATDMIKAFDVFAKFGVPPMLTVKLLHSLNIELDKNKLIALLTAIPDKDSSDDSDDDESLEDLENRLTDLLDDFNS